ncbi:hypothetical protein [Ralstonia pseudosolanacearum]|uniref:hypothetical protein n=1 Tax=Ralstonia pseudosolanacearum TaxID=1310165 RepID=UPI0018D16DB8|nr:hypothetical protein [Ralstonia pseudosolanacearum]
MKKISATHHQTEHGRRLPLRQHNRVPASFSSRSPVMLPISPLEYLAAFALAFVAGVLLSICAFVGKARREATVHA